MGASGRRVLQAALIALCGMGAIAPAYGYDCSQMRYEEAHKRMDMAFKMGVLKNDAGTRVFISESFWRSINFAQKAEFADALVCAVAGARKGLTDLTFRSDMTGKTVGEWRMGTLTIP